MVWTGDATDRLAPALLTLLHQLVRAYPGQQWLNSPQTGTIGDPAHRAEPSSDHNPWLDHTVRALDVAVDVSGVPGIVTVTDGPPGAQLAAMVNAMYAARDPRVYPNGYAIFDGRITDWTRPGQTKPYLGADQHRYHVHISVSQNPAGYNSTAPWPLPGESADSGGATKIGDDMTEDDWKRLQGMINNALLSQRAWITANYGGVPQALSDFKPEIVGSTQRLRDVETALAGQLNTLNAAEMDAIAKVGRPAGGEIDPAVQAAVRAAAREGAAEALIGTTATSTTTTTIQPGGTSS